MEDYDRDIYRQLAEAEIASRHAPPPYMANIPPPDDEWGSQEPTPLVIDLLDRNTRAQAHWRGRGKANGDQSSRGYDIAIAAHVYAAGGNDVDARSAVLSRPDGHAQSMAPEYLDDVLRAARQSTPSKEEKAARAAKELDDASEIVTAVRLYRTDPPIYELTIGGVTFETSAAVIVSRWRLMTRIVEATNTIQKLPKKRYDDWVAGVLAKAEIVAMPDDASESGGILADLSYMLDRLPPGEDSDALERGCCYIDEAGAKHISLRGFAAKVSASHPKLTRPALCKMLRSLGWSDAQARIGEDKKQMRVWKHD